MLFTKNIKTVPFLSRAFGLSHGWRKQPVLPPKPKIEESEFEEKFVKGTGPGGQKINKTSSAVQLRHANTGIVVKSQATRSREQNRTIARRLLAEKLDELENGPLARANLKGDIERRRKLSAVKKSKRKYRLLQEEKNPATDHAQTKEGHLNAVLQSP
jgi:protein subunit release factor B